MKKIHSLITVSFILFTGGQSFSQETDNRDKLQFGIKGGLNYSNVYNSNTEEFTADGKLGLAGGAFFRIPITEFIGVQPEILLSQKGFKGEGMLLGNSYNFSRTTTYLDIPLQIAIHPSEFITIVAGPQYSYLLKQKDEFTSTFYSTSQEQEFDNDNIRRNILGLVAGVDINISHLVIGLRAGWDMQSNRGDGSSSTPQYKNAWIQATVGYTLYR